MDSRNAYIFLEEQYLSLPVPQEILTERGDDIDQLVTGVDSDGNQIIENRTPLNTTIADALYLYNPLKKNSSGNSPIKRYWFNGVDAPTVLGENQNAPLDEDGDEIAGGKVFVIAGIPNFTFDESNAMKKSMDQLTDQATADAMGVDVVNTSFHPWLSHKQALDFIRNGNLPA